MEIISSVTPLLLIISLGFFLKNFFLKEESLWNGANQLVYWVFFPTLMIYSISNSDISGMNDFSFIVPLIIVVISLFGLIWLSKNIFFKNDDFFVSFIQGAVRYNSYVFIGVSTLYFKDYELNIMPSIGLITATMVSLTNVLSVFLLNFYAKNKKSLLSTVANLFKNPLIVSCILGLLLSLSGFRFTGDFSTFLSFLAAAALPLSLLCVGADLTFPNRSIFLGIVICCVIKLLVMPAFVYFLLKISDVPATIITLCVIYAASPCSTNAFAMSKSMGGDFRSMSFIISLQTLFCFLAIPFWLFQVG